MLGDASSAAPSAGKTATTEVRTPVREPEATGSEVRTPAREPQAAGSSIMKWLIPLLLVILAVFFLPKMCRTAPETAPVVKEKPVEATPAQDESEL